MPQSLSRVYLHVIFSTKDREKDLMPKIRDKLHSYIGGTLNDLDCQSIAIGGMADHVHLLFCLGRTITMADVVKQVKANSTLWLKRQLGCNFAWQRGYAVFSLSKSQVEEVRKYIENQEEHHRVRTFQEEYRTFLKLYDVSFDETYVWD